VTSGLIVDNPLGSTDFLTSAAEGKIFVQNDGLAATPLGSWPP
jgi:hypothetical protein